MSFFLPLNNGTLKNAVNAFCSGGNMHDLSGVPIGSWDVSGCTDMAGLFSSKTTFNDDISNWDVSQVTDMSQMFYNASTFNQPLDWNVSKVTNMRSVFFNASAFNQPLNSWIVS